MITGYIGLVLLAVSYYLLFKDNVLWFYRINIIAGVLLTVYAILLQDVIFSIVNGGITVLNSIKLFKGVMK